VRPACLLDQVLQPGSLRAEFQPVLDVTAAGYACRYWEGLVRGPRGSNLERPDVLFGYARRKRAERAVDQASLRTVLFAARELKGSVGVNVHAATLAADLELVPFIGDALSVSGIAPERVVIEIVEHGQPWDRKAMQLNLDGLRAIGMRVALDDFGTGEANHRMLLECRPDLLKVDRYFVHGCHADPRRQAVVEGVAELAHRLGAEVVAEGVEDPADLDRLRGAGFRLAQGNLLCPPTPPERLLTLNCA
jgi:EAL domain-containing protein (putative c-di-GMP-specific phosphodiesterase class I)